MSSGGGVWGRVRRAFSRRGPEPLDPARPDLVVVVSSFDDVEACSTALERGAATEPAWSPESEAVLRHHLELPADSVERAIALAAQDGYAPAQPGNPAGPGLQAVLLQRVQVLDALHCSQERSRMAGLAQRLGGTALGWDALQPEIGAG
ncbi:hypothetical protein [Rhodococcus aetherivorans]|uniref:hypothetical protein n=1 Tax=Rhodococcus aetherivorans TaxID=191292 RepID=UPI003664FB48